jgi:hypothetical protein
VGEDWLEDCNPMWIDYKLKKFNYKGDMVKLQGVQEHTDSCAQINAHKLKGLIKHVGVSHCMQTIVPNIADTQSELFARPDSDQIVVPKDINQLLLHYSHLFTEPVGLPPKRAAGHQIPLVLRAEPVKVRPYRYSPIQKSEIEKQLKQMLSQGVIKPSASPFASPVLLVRKKDGTWRFCVDYRYLNAITMKHKYPMTVVDELLDELAGSQWFTKLDFRSGYHQICMAAAEKYRTTFRTHNGLFEFLVMPFGLTNAPATFQSFMNIIFAELLRKGVLIFMDDILIYSKTLEEHTWLL